MEPLAPDMFEELCPSEFGPIRFADKWAPLVLQCLQQGPRRFSELRIPLPRITPRMLTRTLRTLERDGMITRTARGEETPRVHYTLTPLGRSALDVFAVISAWTEKHWDDLLRSREVYDASGATGGS